MNLVIIHTDDYSSKNVTSLSSSRYLTKTEGESVIDRMIRIGRFNGITKVFYLINSHKPDIEHYLSTNDFGVAIKLIIPHQDIYIQSLLPLVSENKEPLLFVNINSVFLEHDFSEFVTYSLLQEDADGVIAVTRNLNDDKPIGVAMNDEDVILKFNDSKDGYSWLNGGIYYITPHILKENNTVFQSNIFEIEKLVRYLIFKGYRFKAFSFSEITNINHPSDTAGAEELFWLNK